MIPQSGRSPGEGNGNPLQYSCLRNLMDRGAWQATVRGVAEPDTVCCPRSSALRTLLRLSPDSHLHTQGCTFVQGSRPPEGLPRVSPGPSHSTKAQLILCCLPPRCWGSVKAAPPTSRQATLHSSLCVQPSLFSLQVKCCLVDLVNLLSVLMATS